MPAKIITLTQKDQDLLRVALARAVKGGDLPETASDVVYELNITERIKDLKERLL